MYQLAHLNVAKMKFAFEDPEFSEFVDALDPVNAVADGSAGFVWRWDPPDDDPEAAAVFNDDRLLVNFSVWESVDHLIAFVRCKAHAEIMSRRKEWFAPQDQATTVLWWVPSGHIPTLEEAHAKLSEVRRNGASAQEFDFGSPHPAPDATRAIL